MPDFIIYSLFGFIGVFLGVGFGLVYGVFRLINWVDGGGADPEVRFTLCSYGGVC